MPNAHNDPDAARLVRLSDEDAAAEIIRTTILDLWKAVNGLTRLRPSKRDRYRVAIFGSARAQPGTFVYDEVKRVLAADAFVVVPGGLGTVLEMLVVWQLLQVRHVRDVSLVLVGKMWTGFVEWASQSMRDPRLALVNAEDLQIPRCVDTADDAIALVRDFHGQWNAAR